ncbi:hypothetical protein ABZV77_06160 [Streptomyces sp. NPDC004732]|uniref:hypothetical protein n=1 Tax=Streptomyces sp. NPDC004732 TaxID=3154290 RepID=UPI0033B93E51
MRFLRRFRSTPRAKPPENPAPDSYWGHGGDYHVWVDFLRRWAAAEDVHPEALPALTEEDFEGETWERLTHHLGAALDTRLQAWADRFTGALSEATDEFSAGRELTQARVGLRRIRDVAGHPGLPPELRKRLAELVGHQVEQLQQQLEEDLERMVRNGTDPRLVELRRRTLRDNPLTTVTGGATEAASAGKDTPDPWSHDPAAPPRRRVVTD